MFRGCLLLVVSALIACGEAPSPVSTTPSAGPSAPSFEGGKGDSFDEDSAALWAEIAARCGVPADDEPVVYQNDFEWGYTLESMGLRYEEIYHSGKRLADRAYYDEATGQFLLPATRSWGGAVALPARLVENVTLHIEQALQRGYVDYVFFPDMGHSHLFIPEESWEGHYKDYPVSEISRRYEALFDDPELKVLYHTAEQLETRDENDQLLPDREISWRYNTRNLVGDNDYREQLILLLDTNSPANTAHDLEGHKYYGAGFNLSASADGCFPFEVDGERRWYDLSLSDLPFPPGGGGDF